MARFISGVTTMPRVALSIKLPHRHFCLVWRWK